MPCAECSEPERDYYQLLCFDWESEVLFCPNCRDLSVEYDSQVELKLGWLLEERFTDGNIINSVKNYNKTNLILNLIERLNYIANFFEENKMPIDEFGYFVYIIKLVYGSSGFGDEQLQSATELDQDIELLKDAYGTVIKSLEETQTDFSVCIGNPDRSRDPKHFLKITT